MALKKTQKSLKRWGKQKWRTPSGKKSSETGEVYAPSSTIKKLKSTSKGRAKLSRANKKKREATSKGRALKSGKVRKGDGRDIHHRDGNPKNNSKKNLAVTSKRNNRSFPRNKKAGKK